MSNSYKTLVEFLKIKSVSTQSDYLPEMKRAREFITDKLKTMSFKTRILKAKSHDAVFGQLITDPSAPTILIYGHYDVQPAEPLTEWKTEPFIPTIIKRKIYARGATDNKGQITIHIEAVKKFLEQKKRPNINFKFIIEGEEELGSPGIVNLANKYAKTLFKCDYLIVSDSEMPKKGNPAIDISLRGIIYTQIDLEVGKHDLHSGQFGGVSPNPANVLAQIIAELKFADGHINIPGYYKDVVSPTKEELKYFKKLKTKASTITEEGEFYVIGGGEEKYSLNERRWSRPTLDVNGIWGGYQGDGEKTIIPARAGAKISMRLVANQNPEKILKNYDDFVKSMIPKGVKIKITHYISGRAYKSPTDHKIFKLIEKALKHGFGKEPVFSGVGGSIGFVPIVAEKLEVPVLMVGFGLPTENLHAPNENFDLDNFDNGIKTILYFLNNLK